jgi:hypothetical protein
VADQPRRVCIISSDDLLRSGEFIAALGASLRVRPQEPLEIIIDRRHSGSWMEFSLEDRRRQPRVDLTLATNGFAIVPASVNHKEDRTQGLPHEEDEDLKRLESIRTFQRQRSRRLLPKLGGAFPKILVPFRTLPILTKLLALLSGVTLAMFAMSPAGQNLGKSLTGRILEEAPPISGSQAVAPPAAQLPSTLSQAPAVNKNDGLIATPDETSTPPKAGGPTPREPVTKSRAIRTSTKETGTPPKGATTASKPAPEALAPKGKAALPRFAGSPRAELAREPVSIGWGKSYAVRLLNPAGQPMPGAEVWLVARRGDGTVERIPMGALPELGTYRATVPTRPSAPVDLQVRIRMGEKRVEVVPVKP